MLIILPVIGHPRDSKRVSMLQEAGFEVTGLAFEREYYKGRMPTCEVLTLGKIQNGEYFKRLFKIFIAIPKVRKAIRGCNVVYTSGPDMAFLAILANFFLKKPVVLEVGDIQKGQIEASLKGQIIRLFDKFTINRSSMLVATASGFITGYYRKLLKSDTPAIIIENKLDSIFFKETGVDTLLLKPSMPDRPLHIGYFGVLRSNWSFEVLEYLAMHFSDNIKIYIAGIPAIDMTLFNRVISHKNIEYLGKYKSPEGLPNIYKNVDIIWACYPDPTFENTNPLWRWAQLVCRSNRFYESCFYQKPIITLKNSGDGVEVEKHDIGLIIENQEVEAVVKSVMNVSRENLKQWKINIGNLQRKVFLYTDEVEKLKISIKKLVTK